MSKIASFTDEAQSIVNEFVSILLDKYKEDIKKIILFGSLSKGFYLPGSDCDILLVLKEKKQEIINGIYEVVVDFLLKYGIDLSLKIYSENDFESKMLIPTPFMAEIRKTGRELWTQT